MTDPPLVPFVEPDGTPVVIVTGVAADAMAATTIAILWDLPNAVAVHHRIDVEDQQLSRTVSDVTGVLEQIEIDLHHACVSCAIREDIVPTLERLASAGRWDSIIAQLPVGADATQVCRVCAYDRSRTRHLRIGGVVAAVDGHQVVDDLLGDNLLCERGLHTSEDDRRGVGEAFAAMVEYADVVSVVGGADSAELDLLRVLSRPGALVLPDGAEIDTALFTSGLHDHDAAESWVSEIRRTSLPATDSDHVWTMELVSDRPFHPDRLWKNLERLGGGRRRSRGCFWLPSRPGTVCVWDGAGGQLSIGAARDWGRTDPFTRIVVTGMDDDRDELESAFSAALVSTLEASSRGTRWEVSEDGFESWLGDIRHSA